MSELKQYLQNPGPNSHGFVLFHANWCGHCIRDKPEWEKIMKRYKNNPPIRLFMVEQVEAEDYPEFQKNGFPTFSYYRNGQYVEDYSGERTEQAFQQWIHSHTGVRNNKKGKQTMKRKYKGGTLRRRRQTRNRLLKSR